MKTRSKPAIFKPIQFQTTRVKERFAPSKKKSSRAVVFQEIVDVQQEIRNRKRYWWLHKRNTQIYKVFRRIRHDDASHIGLLTSCGKGDWIRMTAALHSVDPAASEIILTDCLWHLFETVSAHNFRICGVAIFRSLACLSSCFSWQLSFWDTVKFNCFRSRFLTFSKCPNALYSTSHNYFGLMLMFWTKCIM